MDSVLVGPCEEKGCFALQGLQIIQFKLGSRCLELMRFLLHPPLVLISFIAKVAQSDSVLLVTFPKWKLKHLAFKPFARL